MLKKWKKTIKFLATTIIVLTYVTIGLLRGATLKGDEKRTTFSNLIAETSEKHSGTVKTIIGYSREFQMRKELEGRILCDAENYPDENGGREASIWKHDRKLGIKIFSAYYDERQERHYVRAIGLVQRNSSLYCQIWYKSNETTTYLTQKAVVQEIWSTKWGPKGKTDEGEYPGIISCWAPRQNDSESLIPIWVTFVNRFCSGEGVFVKIAPPHLQPHPPKRRNFVICVKPLHFTNVNQKTLLEWMEINHGFGAEEIVIYVSNSTENHSVLENYKKRELLTIREFETPPPEKGSSRSFEESIWFKRKMEIIAYNDCFYSNLYQAKFVIPLDVDEIIVPKTGNNWFEAFRSHFLNVKLSHKEAKNVWPEDTDNYASFSVRNAYFFSQYPKDAIIRSLTLPKRNQNKPKKLVKAFLQKKSSPTEGNIFDRTIRSFRFSPNSDSVKSFVHVMKTLSVFNHYAFHVLGNATRQLIFPENIFQLNHYRNSCDPVLIDDCQNFLNHVVFDDSLEKFRNKTKTSSYFTNEEIVL